MSNEKLKYANLKVGSTVLVGIVIFLTFVFLVGTEINIFNKTLRFKIFLSSVEGFSSGSMVALGGLKIGSVDEINFSQKDGVNGVDVAFTINAKYSDQITESSIATIKNKGLLGDKYIDISIGQKGEKPMPDGTYLPLSESISLEKFTHKIEPMMDNLDAVLKNLNTISANLTTNKSAVGVLLNDEKVGGELKSVIADLNSFTKAVSNQKGSLGKLAYDNSLYNNLNNISENLNSLTASLNNGEGTLGKLINEDGLYNEFHSISVRLDKLLSKTESDTTMIGGLLNDGEFYKQFNSLIQDLDKLIIDLKEHPDKYVQFSVF